MRKHLILFSLFLIFVSCERGWIRNLISSEDEIADTIGPTVLISSHTSGQTVFDIITLTVNTEDDGGISKVEFFIDDSLVLTDTESPYQYDWNTTQYESNSEHIIKVISYDNSDNSTESQSILLKVDNTSSLPNGGNITSVTYTLTEMTVEWEESTDGDFNDYKVLYSVTENGDRDTLETYTDKSTTSYTITEFDPLIENWFWVQVTDTLGLSSIGSGMTNSIDLEPNPVNVTSLTYDLTEMVITWGESSDNDFVSYELLQSDSEDGTYTSVTVITDQSTTLHSLTEYDPLVENWFKIKVTDFWNLTSIGSGMTHSLDNVPNPVNVTSVTYDLESMTITWEDYVPNLSRINQMNQNTRSTVTNDFVSYELLQSDSEDGTYTSVVVITDQSTTSHSLIEYNPLQENWFKVKVIDFWGLNSTGSSMTNDIDSPPTQIDVSSVTYDLTEMVVSWNQSNDNDFVSYELLYSETQSGEQTSITTITDISTSSYTITDFNPLEERWYWLRITDYWNLTTMSNGYMVLDNPPTPPVIDDITAYNGGFWINWTKNYDDDFVSYKLYESLSEEMSNDTLIYETDVRHDTTFTKTVQTFRDYQVISEDVWGLQSTSNIYAGDYEVELWGQSYSIENTTGLGLSGLTGEIPPEIGNLTNLEELDLSDNQLTGSIPPEIGNLTNLTFLDLGDNQLTGSIPPEIGNLTNLTYLSLFNNQQLTGSIPSEIGNLTNLEELYLSDNQLTGSIPSEIGNLTNLEELYLSDNQLTGSIPPEIGNLTYVERIVIRSNQLTGSIPSEIGNLTNLEELDLSDNQLTGSIPSEIGNLINLTHLYLAGNQFTGSIPSEIGNLTNLTDLSLNYNQLTGSIPSEIGNLTNLEELYLSDNQLTGEIPESICDLNINWSNNFYISTNQLCPPYPSCIEDYVGEQDTSGCD
jgi:hypothetical protein